MTREEVIELSNSYRTDEEKDKLRAFFSDYKRCEQGKNTIVFSTPSWTGTCYFRLFEPLLSIYRHTDEFNLVFTEMMHPIHADMADLIVIHRAHEIHEHYHDVFDAWPSFKVRPYLIHNVDDIEYKVPKTHSLHMMWKHGHRDVQSLRSLKSSDAVEITTRKMKQTMLSHNKNVIITRNRFNWRLPQWNIPKYRPLTEFAPEKEELQKWDFPLEWKAQGKIIIGWSGLTSHFHDIEKMRPILKAIHDKYPETVFVLAGMSLGDTKMETTIDYKTGKHKTKEEKVTNPDEMYGGQVAKLYSDFDPDRIRIYDALPIGEYGWFNSLYDIALAYVVHDPFSEHKSEIKVIEAMRYNSIPVYSEFGGYAEVTEDLIKKNVLSSDVVSKLSCKTEYNKDEWVNNIAYWVENFNNPIFKETTDALRKYVDKEYDIDLHIENQITNYKRAFHSNIEHQQEMILTREMTYQL